MTPPKAYSARQIRLHWLVAVLIALQFVLNDPISAAWRAFSRGQDGAETISVGANWLVLAHVYCGALVLVFALWRLALRAKRGVPLPPEGSSVAMQKAAHLGHLALYALMILLPLTGIAAWFFAIEPAAEAHEILTNLLLAVLALHVAAALWHHFVRGDGLLWRMWRAKD